MGMERLLALLIDADTAAPARIVDVYLVHSGETAGKFAWTVAETLRGKCVDVALRAVDCALGDEALGLQIGIARQRPPSIVKKRLEGVLQDMLAPIRARREALASDRGYILQMLKEGTARAREVAARTADEVKAALGLCYF